VSNRRLLDKIDKLSKEELNALLSRIATDDYEEPPVAIDVFLDDSYFLGDFFRGKLRPIVREALNEIFPSPFVDKYWLVAFKGATGWGKTWAACAGMLYDTYRLLCMKSPQEFFGLGNETMLVFYIFNVTLAGSKTNKIDVVWDVVSRMIHSSPYFREKAERVKLSSDGDKSMFPKRIDFHAGSRVVHALGQAVAGAILDEANFEVISGQVYQNFNQLLRRMQTRFIRGRIWVVSSEQEKTSVLNSIIKRYENSKGVKVVSKTLWEAVPEKFSGKTFEVFPGSDVCPPFIVGEEKVDLSEEDKALIIHAPIELKSSADADLIGFLRDFAGIEVGSKYKLFRQKEKVSGAMVITPIFPEVIRLSFTDEHDQIEHYLLVDGYFDHIPDSGLPRYIHLDFGLSGDRFGIAACYSPRAKVVEFVDAISRRKVRESVPEIVVEWAFAVEAKKGFQIPIYKVRSFISWLRSKNYPISVISADGFQSEDCLQLLSLAGLKTARISVDKTTLPYTSLRTAIYEDRCKLPKNKLLKEELLGLEISPDGKTIDHSPRGSKDISDGVSGAASSLLADKNVVFFQKFIKEDRREIGETDEIEAPTLAEVFWGRERGRASVADNILNMFGGQRW